MLLLRKVPAFSGEYAAVYPPAYSDTYIKATNYYGLGFYPYLALNPSLPLSGSRYENSWMTASGYVSNQRFHVDLGSAKIIRRILYNNSHHDGLETNVGVQNFVLQGSNSESSFNNLNYSVDTGWTTLSTDISSLLRHTEGLDGEETKIINVIGAGAYRYYALKCSNNYGSTKYMGLRRLVFYE